MAKVSLADNPLDTFRLPQPVAPRYEQDEGNKRYLCPSCGQPAIVSARIGPRQYTCPVTQQVVTAVQVVQAPALEWPKE